MPKPAADNRTPDRRKRDEQIAAQAPLPSAKLPPDAVPTPVEDHLVRLSRRPVALPGVVENGLIRPLDASVKLPENSRVIIVATDGK
jgi:hypothetical protein